MTPERWQQVKQALGEALAIEGDAREAFLATLRVRDADVYREVQQLLAYSRPADAFLEQPAVPAEPLPPGSTFGDYEIQSLLGRGGMGEVFLAYERALDRRVALKFLAPSLERQGEARSRFLREARAAAALDHPYICKILRTGEQSGRPFIAMEYVKGDTLQDRIATRRLALGEALDIVIEIAEALEAAHASKIVHRDLKPANVMLTGQHVKVLDFGLAKRVGASAGSNAETAFETQTGVVQGTLAYMSPEQVEGREVDDRSDIFALGIILYEMVAGEHPFKADVPAETPSLILRHTPPPLADSLGPVPAVLDEAVQRMLAKKPEQRYQDVRQVRSDLLRARGQLERADYPTQRAEAPSRARLWQRRSVGAAVLAAALLLGSVGVVRFADLGTSDVGPLSLVVLPFANVGDNPESEYLATGIAQALTTRLHRAGFRVIPWTTAEQFSGDGDAQQIADALGVDAVLTATLQSDGSGLLVTASLVEDGTLTWTDEFQEYFDSDDAVFALQTRIAQGVADMLGRELTPEGQATLARAESSSEEAYDYYLQGAEYVQQGDPDSVAVAQQYFEIALDIDPSLVEALVGLGTTYYQQFWGGWGTLDDLLASRQAYQQALSADPGDMRALRGLQQIEFVRGNGDSILSLARQVRDSGRDDVEARMAMAQALMLAGLGAPAEEALRGVLALDPLNQFALYHLALNTAYSLSGRTAPDEYLGRFEDPYVALIAGFVHERRADTQSAQERYQRSIRRLEETPTSAVGADWYELSALLYAGTYFQRSGQIDRAEALWQKGVLILEAASASAADNFKAHALLAAFHAFLGDETAFRREEELTAQVLDAEELGQPWDLIYLAAAYARVGDRARALEVLRAQQERLLFGVEHLWPLLGPELWDAPEFVQFRREMEVRRAALWAEFSEAGDDIDTAQRFQLGRDATAS